MTFISSNNILLLRVNCVVHEPNELPLTTDVRQIYSQTCLQKLQCQKKSFHRKLNVCNEDKVISEYLV